MTYIIAEQGSVADGSLGNALRLIEECAKAGADAVKLQCHDGERIKGDPPWFKGYETRAEYLKRTGFTREQWRLIRDQATVCGVDLVVSPFSVEALRLLEELPVDAYKVASGQVTNWEMLRAIRDTGRKVFLSSGMSTNDEDERAYDLLAPVGSGNPVLRMVCTSSYPCEPSKVGLNRVEEMEPAVGFSDHTLGFAASLAAIALGATVIERHVCFDRRGYGTDCAHSLTLDEFARFIREVRELDVMLANPVNKDALVNTPEMQKMRAAFLERTEA
jgi:sialic acid synthase SpsE